MSTLALAASEAILGPVTGRRTAIVRRALFIVAGVLLIAGAAQVRIPLPFTPVPITGQTFAVLLLAATLGARDGALATALYVVAGGAGAPIFAAGASGWGIVTGATGGYLIGFVAAAFLVGWLAERGWDRRFSSAVTAMLTGTVVIYALGVTWLARVMGVSPVSQEALLAGLYPFIIGDVLKLYLAAAALPAAWRFVHRSKD